MGKFKRHSALELTADYPPAALKDLNPVGAPVVPAKKAAEKPQPVVRKVSPSKSMEEVAAEAEKRKAELARRKLRSYEVAMRFAETQRQSELIPLEDDGEFGNADWSEWPEESFEVEEQQQASRPRHRGMAGRGRKT